VFHYLLYNVNFCPNPLFSCIAYQVNVITSLWSLRLWSHSYSVLSTIFFSQYFRSPSILFLKYPLSSTQVPLLKSSNMEGIYLDECYWS
jgi:hypothetical protein